MRSLLVVLAAAAAAPAVGQLFSNTGVDLNGGTPGALPDGATMITPVTYSVTDSAETCPMYDWCGWGSWYKSFDDTACRTSVVSWLKGEGDDDCGITSSVECLSETDDALPTSSSITDVGCARLKKAFRDGDSWASECDAEQQGSALEWFDCIPDNALPTAEVCNCEGVFGDYTKCWTNEPRQEVLLRRGEFIWADLDRDSSEIFFDIAAYGCIEVFYMDKQQLDMWKAGRFFLDDRGSIARYDGLDIDPALYMVQPDKFDARHEDPPPRFSEQICKWDPDSTSADCIGAEAPYVFKNNWESHSGKDCVVDISTAGNVVVTNQCHNAQDDGHDLPWNGGGVVILNRDRDVVRLDYTVQHKKSRTWLTPWLKIRLMIAVLILCCLPCVAALIALIIGGPIHCWCARSIAAKERRQQMEFSDRA